MQIPKYITHPLILVVVAVVAMYVLWLKTPSAADLSAGQDLKIEDYSPVSYTHLTLPTSPMV